MTIALIRRRAQDLHARTRRELIAQIAIALFVVGISSVGIVRTHEPVFRLAFAFALAWELAGQFGLHRGMWAPRFRMERMPSDAALTTGLEYYRRELEQRTDLLRRVLQWSFGPVVLSIAAWILIWTGIARARGLSPAAVLPFSSLVVVWIIAFFVIRSRSQKALRREIDDLTDLANRS